MAALAVAAGGAAATAAGDHLTGTRSAARQRVTSVHLGPVQKLGTGELGDAVTGPDGTAHAFWAGAHRPVARDAVAGTRWGALQRVARVRGTPYAESVGVDARGRVTAAWFEELNSSYRVEVATRTAAGVWRAPTVLGRGPYTDDSVYDVDVTVGRAGHSTLSWNEFERDRSLVTYRTPGNRWARPITLFDGGGEVQAAIDRRGVATFLYGEDHHLMLRQRTPKGWRDPVELSPDLNQNWPCETCTDVDVVGPGVFDVVWTSRDNALHVGRYAHRTWTENLTLLKAPGRPKVGEVFLDATRAGAAYAWVDAVPGTVHASYQAAGTDPGPTATLGAKAWGAVVAQDASGATLAWETASRRLYVSRHGTGAAADAWSAPVEASGHRTRDMGDIALAASSASPTATLVWESPGRDFTILGRSVTATGSAR